MKKELKILPGNLKRGEDRILRLGLPKGSLEQTTIADLATALEQKRRALEKPRKAKKSAAAKK